MGENRIEFLQPMHPGIGLRTAAVTGSIEGGPIQVGQALVVFSKELFHPSKLLAERGAPFEASATPDSFGEIAGGEPGFPLGQRANAALCRGLKYGGALLPGVGIDRGVPVLEVVDDAPAVWVPNAVADDAVLAGEHAGGEGGQGTSCCGRKTHVGAESALRPGLRQPPGMPLVIAEVVCPQTVHQQHGCIFDGGKS